MIKRLINSITVFAILFAGALVANLAVWGISGDINYYDQHSWCVLVGGALAGISLHLFNIKMYGQNYLREKAHREYTLLFIDTKYWPILIVILSIITYLLEY